MEGGESRVWVATAVGGAAARWGWRAGSGAGAGAAWGGCWAIAGWGVRWFWGFVMLRRVFGLLSVCVFGGERDWLPSVTMGYHRLPVGYHGLLRVTHWLPIGYPDLTAWLPMCRGGAGGG